jgi:hypothetical protein
MRPRQTNLTGLPSRSQTSAGSLSIPLITPLRWDGHPAGAALTAQGKTGRFTAFEHTFVSHSAQAQPGHYELLNVEPTKTTAWRCARCSHRRRGRAQSGPAGPNRPPPRVAKGTLHPEDPLREVADRPGPAQPMLTGRSAGQRRAVCCPMARCKGSRRALRYPSMGCKVTFARRSGRAQRPPKGVGGAARGLPCRKVCNHGARRPPRLAACEAHPARAQANETADAAPLRRESAGQPATASSSRLRCWSPSPPTRRLSSIPASSITAAALAGP